MTRLFLIVLASSMGCERAAAPGPRTWPRPDVDAARELDQLGVRSFREARYADAARYFRAAYELGAPSSELWNIARAEERRDDTEAAASALTEYLGRPDLSPADRAEALRESRSLQARPSALTVVTNPPGAFVEIDGRRAPGATPLSIEVPAGTHALAVRRSGYSAVTRSLDARFGRAVIVTLDLAPAAK